MSSPIAPGTPPQGRRQPWLRGALTERLGLKAVALLLAVLLWVIVSARQATQSYVRVRVAPELDSSLALLGDPPVVNALVSGRAADIAKLVLAPPIVRHVVRGDAPDTLSFDVVPSDVRVPEEMVGDVRVLDVQPHVVTLLFETRATRRVPVESDGRVLWQVGARSGPASAPVFDPATVRITGPRRLVRALRSVRPYSLTIDGTDTLPHVADLDTAGLGVRISPTQVRVRLGAVAPVETGAADTGRGATP